MVHLLLLMLNYIFPGNPSPYLAVFIFITKAGAKMKEQTFDMIENRSFHVKYAISATVSSFLAVILVHVFICTLFLFYTLSRLQFSTFTAQYVRTVYIGFCRQSCKGVNWLLSLHFLLQIN